RSFAFLSQSGHLHDLGSYAGRKDETCALCVSGLLGARQPQDGLQGAFPALGSARFVGLEASAAGRGLARDVFTSIHLNSIVIPEAAPAAIPDLLGQWVGGSRLSLRSARMTVSF